MIYTYAADVHVPVPHGFNKMLLIQPMLQHPFKITFGPY